MIAQQLSRWRFSLAELMLMVTLAAASLAIGRWNFLAGGAFFLLGLPTALHARRQARICARRGRTLTIKEQVGNVCYSFGIVIMAALMYLEMWFVAFCFLSVLLGARDSLDPVLGEWIAAMLGLLLLPVPLKMLSQFHLRPELRLELEQSGSLDAAK